MYNIAGTILGYVYRPLATSSVPAKDSTTFAYLAVVCGYVVSSILMYIPFRSMGFRQNFTALWQPSPVYVGLMTASLACLSRRVTAADKTDDAASLKTSSQRKQRQQQNRRRLISLHSVGFVDTAVGHLYTIYSVLKDPDLLFSRIFLPSLNIPTQQEKSILNFLRWDVALCTASATIHGLQSIMEFRCQGYVSTSQAAAAVLFFMTGHALVGPAAAQIGLSICKEKCLLDTGI